MKKIIEYFEHNPFYHYSENIFKIFIDESFFLSPVMILNSSNPQTKRQTEDKNQLLLIHLLTIQNIFITIFTKIVFVLNLFCFRLTYRLNINSSGRFDHSIDSRGHFNFSIDRRKEKLFSVYFSARKI